MKRMIAMLLVGLSIGVLALVSATRADAMLRRPTPSPKPPPIIVPIWDPFPITHSIFDDILCGGYTCPKFVVLALL